MASRAILSNFFEEQWTQNKALAPLKTPAWEAVSTMTMMVNIVNSAWLAVI